MVVFFVSWRKKMERLDWVWVVEFKKVQKEVNNGCRDNRKDY